jgi:phospholipid-binding lipoprotein MlaA
MTGCRDRCTRWQRGWLWALAAAAVLSLAGCATAQDAQRASKLQTDPWEGWNRKVFAFNEGLDQHFLQPAATTYVNVLPRTARTGVDNFFNNVSDAWSVFNNLLQGNGGDAFQDFWRVTIDTTLGVFGLFDWASEFGLEHHYADFGQTLGRWGVQSGPYVVWPLFGSSTVRDTFELPLDIYISPTLLIHNTAAKWGVDVVHVINTRADLLGATKLLDEIALDKYQFVRDAYLQRRRSKIYGADAADDSDAADPSDYAPATPATPAVPGAPPPAAAPK